MTAREEARRALREVRRKTRREGAREHTSKWTADRRRRSKATRVANRERKRRA